MSANITIKEGGQGKILNAIKKLKISTGNGTSLWLPENDLVLDDKSITKNGTYKASDDGLYGYSEVTVNVAKKSSVTGKKPDGNDYNVERDPDGNIIETKLPSSIRLTTNPTKMSYINGESINMTGAVVKAYCADGTLWEGDGYSGGVIPLSEIEVSPTVANVTERNSKSTSDISNLQRFMPIDFNEYYLTYKITGTEGVQYIYSSEYGAKAITSHLSYQPSWLRVVVASDTPNQDLTDSFSYNGKTVYYKSIVVPFGVYDPDPVIYGINHNLGGYSGSIAWTMIYGNITEGGQKITLSWQRPKDDKELTTSFNIMGS